MDDLSLDSTFSKPQRLLFGLFILFLVDIIWVLSSELTKFIYHNEAFEKPFFSTYFKTSMFTLYLLGFCFWPPWRDHCNRPTNYMLIDPSQEDENFYTDSVTSLSNPVYVPVKTAERHHSIDRSSGTESDDSSIRSVRFHKLAEVRHMSESEAAEALLARLSYQASVKAGEIARRAASKLSMHRVAKLALIFCLLWFIANYTYQLALAKTEAGVVNLLSSTSSLFTLILSGVFPSIQADKFSISKLVAVTLSISGLIAIYDMIKEKCYHHIIKLPIQANCLVNDVERQNSWLTTNLHGLRWDDESNATLLYADVSSLLRNIIKPHNNVMVKGLEKKVWLEQLLHYNIVIDMLTIDCSNLTVLRKNVGGNISGL